MKGLRKVSLSILDEKKVVRYNCLVGRIEISEKHKRG